MRRYVLMLTLGVAGACQDHGMGSGMSADEAWRSFDEATTTTEQALSTHHQAVGAADDLDAVRELERDHAGAMMGHMEEMVASAEHMGACMMDDRAGHEMGGLDDAMEMTHDEMLRHREAMDAAPDLEAAEAEETRHHETMGEQMEAMRGHGEGMRDAAGGGMMCSGM